MFPVKSMSKAKAKSGRRNSPSLRPSNIPALPPLQRKLSSSAISSQIGEHKSKQAKSMPVVLIAAPKSLVPKSTSKPKAPAKAMPRRAVQQTEKDPASAAREQEGIYEQWAAKSIEEMQTVAGMSDGDRLACRILAYSTPVGGK